MGERLERTRHPGVYRTPRGHYTTYVVVDGQRKWKTFGRSVREAVAWRADLQSRARRGELSAHLLSNMTFGAFAELFLEDQLQYEPRTHDVTKTVMNVHLLPYWGRRKLRSIGRRDVQDWVKLLSSQSYIRADQRHRYASSTVRDVYKHFRKIITAAVADGYLRPDPCRRIQLPRVERIEQRFLTEQEVEKVATVMDRRYRVMVYVCAYLGLRWEEVSALRPSDLDLETTPARLTIRGSLSRSDGRVQYRTYGKSAAARRSLKIPDFLRGAFDHQLATYSNMEWVFPAPNGGFLRYDNFRGRFWTPAVAAAGVSGSGNAFTFHQLRHTAAAFMIDDGGDPLHVMRRMGHSDIRTTYNLYGHKFPDREDELVARLDARFDRMTRSSSPSSAEVQRDEFGFRSDSESRSTGRETS
jgi:integrase